MVGVTSLMDTIFNMFAFCFLLSTFSILVDIDITFPLSSEDVADKLQRYFTGHLVALKEDFDCNLAKITAKVLLQRVTKCPQKYVHNLSATSPLRNLLTLPLFQ